MIRIFSRALRQGLRLLLATAGVFFLAAPASAQAPSPGNSWEKILQKWNTRSHFQALGQKENSLQYLNEIRQLQQEGGLPNLSALAATVTREALSSAEEEQAALLEAASALAPDEALPLGIRTAKAWRFPSPAIGAGFTELGRYWSVVSHDAFQLAPILLSALEIAASTFFWLALSLCLLIALRTSPLLWLDLRRRAPLAIPLPLLILAATLAVALPWFFWGAPGALFAFLFLYWKFFNAQEKICGGLLLLLMAATPLVGQLRAAALSFGPHHSDYPLYMADRLPRLEESAVRLTALQAVRPHEERIPFQLALLYKRQGRWNEALSEIKAALQLRPQWAAAESNRGLILIGQGQEEEARAAWRKAVELDGHLFAARYNLGKLLFRSAALEEARENLSRAQALDPERFAAQEARGKKNETSVNLFFAEARLPQSSLWESRFDSAAARAALRPAAGTRALPNARWLWPLLLLWLPLCQLGAFLLWPKSRPRNCRCCGEAYDLLTAPPPEGQGLCVQCVNIYQRKAAIEPAVRAMKERRVLLHRWLRGPLQTVAGFLFNGSAYALDGAALLGAVQLTSFYLLLFLWLTPLAAPLTEYAYDNPLLLLGRYAALLFFVFTLALNGLRLVWREAER